MCRSLVTICIAQWSLYVPHSGHYIHRRVVTIYTAEWSLYIPQSSHYIPHSDHYIYCRVVIICTAQWSLYVPHSGHYMYRTMVTICTSQWSLHVPHNGHYMYSTAVTLCTAQRSLYVPPAVTSNNSTFCAHSEFMCFVWISDQTAIISPYSINSLVFITETDSVYCAVRVQFLNTGSILVKIYCLQAVPWLRWLVAGL